MSEKKKYIDMFTIFKKGDFLHMKPNLSKFGVRKIVVTTNDGEDIHLTMDTFIPLNDPRESIKKFEKDEGKVEERIQKLDDAGIARTVTAVI